MIFEKLASWWQKRHSKPAIAGLGGRGEAVAARFLQKQGLRVVESNWHCPGGEVDLIARHGDVLVFIEVKTRQGGPVEAEAQVDADKEARVTRAADLYLRRWPEEDWPLVRFDIVAVTWAAGEEPEVKWIRDAFA